MCLGRFPSTEVGQVELQQERNKFPLAQRDLGISFHHSMCKGGNCQSEPTSLWGGTESHGSSAQGCDHVPGLMGPCTSPSPLLPVHPPLLLGFPGLDGKSSHTPTKQDGASSDHPYPPPSSFLGMEPALFSLIPSSFVLGWHQLCSSLPPAPSPAFFFGGDGAGSAFLHPLLPSPAPFFGMELVLSVLTPYPSPFLGMEPTLLFLIPVLLSQPFVGGIQV